MAKMVCECGNVLEFIKDGALQCEKCKATWDVKKIRENLFLARRV